jgi:hypothetical protein
MNYLESERFWTAEQAQIHNSRLAFYKLEREEKYDRDQQNALRQIIGSINQMMKDDKND